MYLLVIQICFGFALQCQRLKKLLTVCHHILPNSRHTFSSNKKVHMYHPWNWTLHVHVHVINLVSNNVCWANLNAFIIFVYWQPFMNRVYSKYPSCTHISLIPYNSLTGVDLFHRSTGNQSSAMPRAISSLVWRLDVCQKIWDAERCVCHYWGCR